MTLCGVRIASTLSLGRGKEANLGKPWPVGYKNALPGSQSFRQTRLKITGCLAHGNRAARHNKKCNRVMDYSKATAEVYRSATMELRPQYERARSALDYSYHFNPTLERQDLQDHIVEGVVKNGVRSQRPWLLFTAGAMGAGKSFCMKKIFERGYFNLDCFAVVDPDQIRRELPEYDDYIAYDNISAGEKTQQEASLIAQIATEVAIQRRKHVIVDGSLRDWSWYMSYFQHIRREQPYRRIAIIHVEAPRDAVYKRAERRAKITGRAVPRRLLDEALEQVPKSVEMLAPLTDYTATILNSGDELKLISGDGSWLKFKERWGLCPDPYDHSFDPEELDGNIIKL